MNPLGMTTLRYLRAGSPLVVGALLSAGASFGPLPAYAQPIDSPPMPTDLALPDRVSGNESYTLGAGDKVRIDVFKVTQYSGDNQVLVDGSLNLPQVGSVKVDGLTLKQAAEAVSAKYARILRYPYVTITLLTPRPVRIAVSGEVNRPGSYTLSTTETGSQLPTVTQALQLAGGTTQVANLREVEIRRPRNSGNDEIIKINLWEFLKSGDMRRDVALRSGDTIYIPTATTTNLAESVQLASASFATDKTEPLNIAIVGEVYRPGPYIVTTGTIKTQVAGTVGDTQVIGSERPPTITRAIQLAGGIKPLADIRQIQVRRLTRSGTGQAIQIDLWKLLRQGDVSQDLILQDRDTVIIPTATSLSAADATELAAASFSPDTIQVNVVGEVKVPGIIKLPPNTPLNQAILAAGGFNVRARKRSVELIRLNPNGSVTRRKIAIDLARGIDEATNPILRKDDIVVVDRSSLAAVGDALGTIVGPIGGLSSIFNFFRLFGN